ncbi:MAG: hypothetical protein H6563_13440 [Lewinellaceae bacterium]|nr:hypothetical protein [Lewinellaceae bacterium]
MPDFSHCLRKAFTNDLYGKLVKGNSINLVGPRFNGRLRLLEDLAQLARQDGNTAVVVDMNHWKTDYEGFVNHAQEQVLLAAPASVPEEASRALVPAEHLSKALSAQLPHHQRIILLLNNFDAILDNPQRRFPKTFFDDLNSLRHKSNLSLCAVTQKSHLQSTIYYKEETEFKNTLSWLELEIVELARPTLSEVREELNRRLQEVSHWREEPEKERFVVAVQDHTAFYRFMEIVCNSFGMNHQQISAEMRLQQCYMSFEKNYRRAPENPWPGMLSKGQKIVDYWVGVIERIGNILKP